MKSPGFLWQIPDPDEVLLCSQARQKSAFRMGHSDLRSLTAGGADRFQQQRGLWIKKTYDMTGQLLVTYDQYGIFLGEVLFYQILS